MRTNGDILATLDDFTAAYIEAALWSSTDEKGNPLDSDYDESDIDRETLQGMVADCKAFQEDNARDIGEDSERAGHDFWMTRNHHGAGFWDGDWPCKAGKRLTEASHAYGSVDLYVSGRKIFA